jgi:toxin ParE1/3/4
VTTVRFAPEVAEDIARISSHLANSDSQHRARVVATIRSAIQALEMNPEIGRPRGLLRELIIGRGHHGHIALYEYREREELVLVLALRAQRESGYKLR